jgi:hypothetical protein
MRFRIVVAVLALAVFLSHVPAASAQSAAEVRSALAGMKTWLGNSPRSAAWHEYLRTADLEAELARGDEADEVVIFGVLARYTSGQPGLETPQVARVAEALGAWHEQMKPASAANLPELAAAAKDQLTPASKTDVAAAREELAAALRGLDAYLGTGPNGAGWRQALGLDQAIAQLRETEPDFSVLSATYRALSGDTPGLEERAFRVARRALLRYFELASYAVNGQSDERTAAALAIVAEDLAAYPEGHDGERARRLGRALGYLRRHGQAERLVAAARRQYCQPNVFVELSDEFLAAGFEDDVDMVSPVRQHILGTDVYGTGRTVGRLHFRLHPQNRRAAFETQLVGTTRTKTTGYNGPVTIYSTGETQLRATTRFLFDANGLTAEPTTSTADVDNTIHSIESGRCGPIGRFIERMAWKRAGQSEALAESIASERAQEQANREVDRQATERLVDVNKRYQRRFRDPLLRRDRLPLLHASTTDKAMRVEVLQVDQDQLAAPTPPPDIEGDPLISARMHESAANNFASSVLSGETLTQQRIEQIYRDFERPLPEELKRDPDEPAWSMTFARLDPVTIELRDGELRVVLRGEKYTSGDRSFEAMNIAATYKIERTDTGVRLVRQGDLVISPPGHKPGERLSAGQISLRRLLTRRFGNLFKPEIVTTGLKMEGNFAELGTLTLSQFACENGWATLGWNQ